MRLSLQLPYSQHQKIKNTSKSKTSVQFIHTLKFKNPIAVLKNAWKPWFVHMHFVGLCLCFDKIADFWRLPKNDKQKKKNEGVVLQKPNVISLRVTIIFKQQLIYPYIYTRLPAQGPPKNKGFLWKILHLVFSKCFDEFFKKFSGVRNFLENFQGLDCWDVCWSASEVCCVHVLGCASLIWVYGWSHVTIGLWPCANTYH